MDEHEAAHKIVDIMLWRAIKILEHAKVQAAKIFLESPMLKPDVQAYVDADAILHCAMEDVKAELLHNPPPLAVRPFRSRSFARN